MLQVDTTKRPQQPDTSHHGVALGTPHSDSATLTSSTAKQGPPQSTTQALQTQQHSQTLTQSAPVVQPQVATPAVAVQPVEQTSAIAHFYFYDTIKAAKYTADTAVEEYHLFDLDSVMAACARTEPLVHPSIFSGHTLQVDSPFPQTYPHHEEHVSGWAFGIVLLLAVAVGWFMKGYRLRFGEMVQSLASTSALGRMFRDHGLSNEVSLLPMAVVYVAALALLGCYTAGLYDIILLTTSPFINYLIMLGCCAAYYFIRIGLTLLFGIIFQKTWTCQVYVTNTYLFNFFGAIALIPIMLVGYYGELDSAPGMQLLYVAGGWVALLFLLRMVRGVQLILSTTKGASFYLFYYLCILEIVPILVAIKIFLL